MSSISNTINEFNRRIGSYLPRIIELKVFQIVPRVFLYFFAIPVLQCSSTIAGVGFILNDQKLVLGSSIFLIVWFFIMFLISISSTDRLLYSKISFVKRGSLIIFIALIAGGLFEGTVLIISQNMSDSPDSKVEQVLSSFHEGFSYNDSTALTHQAINNLLNGENPYIYSNVVSALSEFNPASERVTPLRVGRFSEIFPYRRSLSLHSFF